MGVGKTLLAILAMWKVKGDPGFSLVLARKSVCPQWVAQIEGAWEQVSHPLNGGRRFKANTQYQGYEMRAL